MAVNLDHRKAHFGTHVSAPKSILTLRKTHLPPSPRLPDVFLSTPPRSSPLDSLSRVCLLSSPGQTVPASSTISPMKSEGAAKQSALPWLGCVRFTLVNRVPCFRAEWKCDCHLPRDPVPLVTHSLFLFLGSHTAPLTKINFTTNQANTSLF